MTHSNFGLISPLFPLLLLLAVFGAFDKPGLYLALISPALAAAAVFEALVAKRKFLVPLLSLIACLALSSFVFYALVSD